MDNSGVSVYPICTRLKMRTTACIALPGLAKIYSMLPVGINAISALFRYLEAATCKELHVQRPFPANPS